MAALHGQPQQLPFSPARITAKMASAPPFVPQSYSPPSFPLAPDWLLSLPAAAPPLPPPPVFHHLLGFHHIRHVCFLHQPLPPAPPISPCSPPTAGEGRVARKGTWYWMTKEEAERRRRRLMLRQSSSSFSSSSMEFDEVNPLKETRTTVMIKNIPNKLSRELLVSLLDGHCAEENRKLRWTADPAPPSEFDFVYLPVDFRTNCGLGYAFVNFTSPQAAWRFHRAMEKHRWGLFETRKIGHVCYARIQGKDAMVANFWSSSFKCDSDEFLPATFTPARDGAAPLPPATVVGRRLPRFGRLAAATEAGAEATEAAVPV